MLVGAFGCALAVGPPTDKAVAIVNGAPISHTMIDEYGLVFTDPEGNQRISQSDLLLSLINQTIVHEEARRRGIHVDQADIDAAIADGPLAELEAGAQARTGGNDALRRRMSAFIEMDRVKADVVAELVADGRYGTPAPEDLTGSLLLQHVWSDWLAERRSCAVIVVHEPSFDVPSSTPGQTAR